MTRITAVWIGLPLLLLASVPTTAWSQCYVKTPPAKPYQLNANEAWVNYGTRWNGWSGAERLIYLEGLVDGGSRVFGVAYNFAELNDERRECLRLTMAVVYDSSILSAIVTDLYRDPANTYIGSAAMVFIARDKLDGKDIESRLRNARETERSFYRLSER